MKEGRNMYKQVSKLIVYRDLGNDSILRRLADIFEDFDLSLIHISEPTRP